MELVIKQYLTSDNIPRIVYAVDAFLCFFVQYQSILTISIQQKLYMISPYKKAQQKYEHILWYMVHASLVLVG